MITLRVNIYDGMGPALTRQMERCKDKQGLHAAMGMAVEAAIAKHIEEGPARKPNKLGGTSTGFWRDAANSTKVTASSSEALVSIQKRGVALQYFGGVVKPQSKSALTIPIHPMAHGKRVRDLGGPLIPIRTKRGDTVLVTNPKGKKQRGHIGGIAVYVLKKSATIPAHPEVLPTVEAMASEARMGASTFMNAK